MFACVGVSRVDRRARNVVNVTGEHYVKVGG